MPRNYSLLLSIAFECYVHIWPSLSIARPITLSVVQALAFTLASSFFHSGVSNRLVGCAKKTCSEIIIGKLASISIIFINDFKKIMYSYGANRFQCCCLLLFLSRFHFFGLNGTKYNTGTATLRNKLSEKITLIWWFLCGTKDARPCNKLIEMKTMNDGKHKENYWLIKSPIFFKRFSNCARRCECAADNRKRSVAQSSNGRNG